MEIGREDGLARLVAINAKENLCGTRYTVIAEGWP